MINANFLLKKKDFIQSHYDLKTKYRSQMLFRSLALIHLLSPSASVHQGLTLFSCSSGN